MPRLTVCAGIAASLLILYVDSGIQTTVLTFTFMCKDFTHLSVFPVFQIHLKGDVIKKKSLMSGLKREISESEAVSGIMLPLWCEYPGK